MNIIELYKIINDRKINAPKKSYTASLFREGRDRIIQKVGEEAVELVIASKNDDKERTISEIADLLFHTLVLMSYLNIEPSEIMSELDNRHK